MIASCSSSKKVDPEWSEDDYLEVQDQDEVVMESPSRESARPEVDSSRVAPTEHEFESQNYGDNLGFFFDAYPPDPLHPPAMRDRERAYGFEPGYGVEEYLPTVPLNMVKPFPRDYVGVERWNRDLALPSLKIKSAK